MCRSPWKVIALWRSFKFWAFYAGFYLHFCVDVSFFHLFRDRILMGLACFLYLSSVCCRVTACLFGETQPGAISSIFAVFFGCGAQLFVSPLQLLHFVFGIFGLFKLLLHYVLRICPLTAIRRQDEPILHFPLCFLVQRIYRPDRFRVALESYLF